MLAILCATFFLFALGVYVVGKVAQQVMNRLDLDLLSILLWLGLAERHIEPGPPRRA